MVADLEPHLAVLAADVDLDRAVGGGVDERVADEVAEHLAQLVGVAEHERGAVRVDRDRAARSGGVRVGDGVAREWGEVDRRVRGVGDLVEPRERQQILDQHAHARGLVLDPSHRLLDVLVGARGAHPVQLGVAADRGQRRAQLVRGVGNELAQPVLARAALLERVLEPVEHPIKGSADAADLGAFVGHVDAVGEIAARDPPGGVADAVEREQAVAHHDPADGREHEQHADDHETLDEDELVERAVDFGERNRHDGDVAVAERRGDEPVAGRVLAGPRDRLRLADLDVGGDLRRGGDVLAVVEQDRVAHAVGPELAVGAGRQADAGAAAARRAAVVVAVAVGDVVLPIPCSARAPATAPAPWRAVWSIRSYWKSRCSA